MAMRPGTSLILLLSLILSCSPDGTGASGPASPEDTGVELDVPEAGDTLDEAPDLPAGRWCHSDVVCTPEQVCVRFDGSKGCHPICDGGCEDDLLCFGSASPDAPWFCAAGRCPDGSVYGGGFCVEQ